jgi:hypothetical protein
MRLELSDILLAMRSCTFAIAATPDRRTSRSAKVG